VSTTARWTAPDGHVTDLAYQVLTDRAAAHVGLVQLQLTPHWSGTATVSDIVDGSPATLTTPVKKSVDTGAHTVAVTVQTQGTDISAAVATQLLTSGNVQGSTSQLASSDSQTAGEQLAFHVTAGQTYTLTKYVGVEDSLQASNPTTAAQADARSAAETGFAGLLAASNSTWSALWNGRIDILGNEPLATAVNASEFYLWSSTRAGVNWSISPAGLSSNGYAGHIFWDAETWMYPSLLAQHPDLAAGLNA